MISGDGVGLEGIFDPAHLNKNYKKLDEYYQKKLVHEELDERHFINEDTKGNHTPVKITPFARQGMANKLILTPNS